MAVKFLCVFDASDNDICAHLLHAHPHHIHCSPCIIMACSHKQPIVIHRNALSLLQELYRAARYPSRQAANASQFAAKAQPSPRFLCRRVM